MCSPHPRIVLEQSRRIKFSCSHADSIAHDLLPVFHGVYYWSMNKKDLIRFTWSTSKSRGVDLTYHETEVVVDAFLSGIQSCLDMNEHVSLTGFGRFDVKHSRAVDRRAPVSGELVKVPAKRGVTFKPSLKLKGFLNRG